MHFRFDHFFKKLLRALLSAVGRVDAELEVAVDAQRIDLLFTPGLRVRPRRRGAGRAPAAPAAPDLEALGLLGRIVASCCILEAFHAPPSVEEIRGCMRKQLNWHHLQVLRAKRRARASRAPLRPKVGRTPQRATAQAAALPPPIPVLWILSSGRPAGVVERFAFQPFEGWPAGVYTAPLAEVPVRLVVVSELPRTRETLTLRVFGRGATLAQAAREVAALPRRAPERRHIAPLLVSLRRTIERVQATGLRTEEEKELLVHGQKVIDAFDAIENKGWKRGREQGLQPLVHQLTRRLGRPLTDRERATVVRRLDTLGPDRLGDVVLDLDAAALATWLANPRAR